MQKGHEAVTSYSAQLAAKHSHHLTASLGFCMCHLHGSCLCSTAQLVSAETERCCEMMRKRGEPGQRLPVHATCCSCYSSSLLCTLRIPSLLRAGCLLMTSCVACPCSTPLRQILLLRSISTTRLVIGPMQDTANLSSCRYLMDAASVKLNFSTLQSSQRSLERWVAGVLLTARGFVSPQSHQGISEIAR